MPETETETESDKLNRLKILDIKKNKSRGKAAFTRSKHQLLDLLTAEDLDVEKIRECQRRLDRTHEDVLTILETLCTEYIKQGDKSGETKTSDELDEIASEYENTHDTVRKAMDKSVSGVSVDPEPKTPEHDMWKQLKRISIPVFKGDKRKYASWKATFTACVDKAPSSDEYKLLQLRQYLGGEALSCIDNLGHSSAAYTAAKDRLDRKYGGEQRQVAMFLEELERFPPFHEENCKTLERFADLLDIAVINLKEKERELDLGDGALYNRLQRKMPENMIVQYHRWIHENEETESVETLRDWVILESKFHMRANEMVHGLGRQTKENRGQDSRGRESRRYDRSFVTSNKKQAPESKLLCRLCNGHHGIWKCESFKSLPSDARWDKAKELNLCFRCLADDHMGQNCKKNWKCRESGCAKNHHTLLHNDKLKPGPYVDNKDRVHHGASCDSNENVLPKYVALRTVPVIIDNGYKQLRINAILDDGSTQTYINIGTAMELGIPIHQPMQNVTVNVLNGKTETFQTTPVTFNLRSLNGQVNTCVEASTIENVTGSLKAIEITDYANQWEHLKGIKFPSVGKKQHVDLLIGLDYADLHQSLHEIHGKPGEPIARLTPLGWTCVGNLSQSEQHVGNYHTFLLHKEQSEINKTLRRFWEIDDGGIENEVGCMSVNDKLLLEKSEESIKSLGDNSQRYQIDIPWNEKKSELSDNTEMAEKRLKNTEKRLMRDPELHEKYDSIIQDYESKGYVSKTKENDDKAWYIPHFPVIRPDRSTTKVRIVFDASAKQDGIALNDAIEQGPPLQTDLFDVLVRFRRHSVAVACDIQEMYLQVGIPVADRKYHRFLWRSTPESEIEKYEFSRLVFGVNASPFLAQCVSRYNAKSYAEEYPLAKETVLKSTYMDDSLDSVPSVEMGIELYSELSELWKKAGMFARKWISNSTEVLSHIPASDRAQEADFSRNELPEMKTLGVFWQAEEDCFTFKYGSFDMNIINTKRKFLSKIASLYDPLGFLVPYTIKAKMLMQDIWVSGVEWDEILTDDTIGETKSWFSDLENLQNVKIPRNLQVREHKKSELHTFVDASTKAYCAVTYIRNENDTGETFVNMVAAKSKVVPIQSMSVPRLELLGAVLGLRLTEKVCKSLEINIKEVCFWSDSMNTLWWIRNQSRQFKPFVANRLGDIQSKTDPEQWRYVPSENNPADLGSRGTTVKHLSGEKQWWSGPEFLAEAQDKWPKNDFKPNQSAQNEQRKKCVNIVNPVFLAERSVEEDRLDPKRFSSWVRMIRVYAWVLRFINNCQVTKSERQTDYSVKSEELESAQEMIIRAAQRENFQNEYNALKKGRQLSPSSKILNLNPKLDDTGIIRSDSRLKYAEFIPYDIRCPVILPRKDWVTKLVVRHYHEQCNHGGTNQTLAALSTRYWIVAAREEIREVENECRVCRKRKVKASQQIMGPIPDIRLGKRMRAFSETAVDYAGPFLTKQGRGKPRNKRYLCLFTCMACRAVHLELAFSLDTDSFLNAFYRFVNRRGFPEVVLSDNGTNFVGACRELKELVDALDKDKIVDSVANKGVQWQFIPPGAPHFGGVHEAMVKSAKRAVYSILGNADINDEELLTAFSGAEGLINSRPLTYQSANPEDEPVLTPNHFLHGQVGGQFAPESVDVTAFNIKRRWRRVQELVKHFWGRWFREFLPTLGSRKKWFQERRDFHEGDVVVVIDPDAARGHWKVGKILEVFRGPDSHVRVVNVKVGGKVVKRPITRVCLLEEDQSA